MKEAACAQPVVESKQVIFTSLPLMLYVTIPGCSQGRGNPDVKIKTIGCSGSEVPGFNFASYMLDEDILFDAGSITNVLGIEAQMKIRTVFITHSHLDHVKCIPFLADNLFLNGPARGIDVAAPAGILENLKKHIFNEAMWPDFTRIPSPDNPVLNLVALREEEAYRTNKYSVTPYRVNHNSSAVGYLVEEMETGKRFFYSGDTGPAHGIWQRLGGKKLDCLLVDVSLPNAMEDQAIEAGHLTPLLLKTELAAMQYPPKKVWAVHAKPFFLDSIARELDSLGIEGLGLLAQGQEIEIT